MFDTVLVANRGEIAVRIFRTLHSMGIRSVAVFSDADADSRHVRTADAAFWIGPSPAIESYLNIDRVIEAALRSGAQAVHPGYGFLSENAEFARACQQSGLVFIGPNVDAIEIMGDKIRAKRVVSAAGIPVVPGRAESTMTDDDLVSAATEIGFPLLLKPSAGGGGKGMRLVSEPEYLGEAIVSARREAESSFGDDALFLERFVINPRHIEVQVLADRFGNTVHLGERECSLQRRHQKVIEEAPSMLLDGTRGRLTASAVQAALSVRYLGVGTVEFIMSADAPDEFFFIEMNTRLQVEHPVTELVTGLDLVEQQLRVASGERLAITQDDVCVSGHAIEARLYAEDPARGFVPTGGRVLFLREPSGVGVRVDSSLEDGGDVPTNYDPMVSKIAAHGPDRETALARLTRALSDTVVLGMNTNVSFLRSLLANEDVRAARLDTGLIERELSNLVGGDHDDNLNDALCVAAIARVVALEPPGGVIDRWDVSDGWRLGEHAPMTWIFETPSKTYADVLAVWGASELRISVSGLASDVHHATATCRSRIGANEALIDVDEREIHTFVAVDGDTVWTWVDGVTTMLRLVTRNRQRGDLMVDDGDLRAPMPGNVVELAVRQGDRVEEGSHLAVIEAMKMENAILAPFGAVVTEVLVSVGEHVAMDQLMVRLATTDNAPTMHEEVL
jgi:acetyl-CoA/propionyl-CoA carboxylase, biotin carboxylase, biotin carboxyl carrier protein